ncbi:MAG: O-antigen ligase family protein [Planctomycetota bacterium]
MAKRKQRLKRGAVDETKTAELRPSIDAPPRGFVWARGAAFALLGGLAVYVAYYPSDSVLVERGDALWFCAGALLLVTLTLVTEPTRRRWTRTSSDDSADGDGSSLRHFLGKHLLVDVFAWNLAAWMMLSALAMSPPGNLRQATNEAWMWIAGAAVLSSARRLLSERQARTAMMTVLFGLTVAMSVHTLHQQWISLPETRAAYQQDPDAIMSAAGVEAPEWSSQRMIFANRLFDGGPTAQFALANSLAAVLPIAVLIGAGLLWQGWRADSPWVVRGLLAALLLVASLALFYTRSRSAVAACFVGVAWLGVFASGIGKSLSVRRSLMAAGAVVLALATITIGFLLLGDEEWMASAPSSLLFRLRYWRSTLALLGDHPWMGAGPGGFQTMYLRYRLPVSSETIADPHNFVFETLASGGLVAGVLLMALAWACQRAKRANESDASVADDPSPFGMYVLYVGVISSLVMIWLFSLVSAQLPDFEAAVFAVPLGIASACIAHYEVIRLSDRSLTTLATAILVVMLLHLCFAGGWTIPGVAIWIWMMVAMICHAGHVATSENATVHASEPMARRLTWTAGLVGASLLICLRLVSLGPVQSSNLAQLLADDSLQRGFASRTEEQSLRAMTADTWAVEPAIWRSQYFRGKRVAGDDTPKTRRLWRESAETALERAGENPLVRRTIAEQSLHFYQRFGREEDLLEAEQMFVLAIRENPTDVSLIAQMALVALEKGDSPSAVELARRAEKISLLDGNVVQALGLQHVYAVEKIGLQAAGNAILRRVETEFDRKIDGWRETSGSSDE